MSIEDFFTTPVTIISPGLDTDRYDDVVPDWANPASSTVSAGWLIQTSTTEETEHRDTEVSGWRLFLPADAPISAGDRVTADPETYEKAATTYEVDGTPNVVSTPTGPHHVEAVLRLVQEVE